MHHKLHFPTRNFSRMALNLSLAVSLLIVASAIELVSLDVQSVISTTHAVMQPTHMDAGMLGSWHQLSQVQALLV